MLASVLLRLSRCLDKRDEDEAVKPDWLIQKQVLGVRAWSLRQGPNSYIKYLPYPTSDANQKTLRKIVHLLPLSLVSLHVQFQLKDLFIYDSFVPCCRWKYLSLQLCGASAEPLSTQDNLNIELFTTFKSTDIRFELTANQLWQSSSHMYLSMYDNIIQPSPPSAASSPVRKEHLPLNRPVYSNLKGKPTTVDKLDTASDTSSPTLYIHVQTKHCTAFDSLHPRLSATLLFRLTADWDQSRAA
ncbi:hypothetical protein EV421DRAFT_1742346 [Armillaria borealis]|uniref:Uncharacterized protein n=1 Tax=Armillaria borealis TaxID=47425 RepID=A0AA39MEY5_9AGAR|nr:hypothetical protein EV421DRAFT_1742346 [Armillaria borealis]